MLNPTINLGMTRRVFTSHFKTWLFLIFILMQSCGGASTPTGIQAIDNFNLDNYLGTWYEIARLNHSFERGLEQVTATYTKNLDGSVKVTNAGTNKKGKRKTKIGIAKFVGNPTTGHLKVSFFRPFYGSYVLFHLDESAGKEDAVALITGDTKEYCWILSRKTEINEDNLKKYLKILQEKGFDTSKLIYPAPYQNSTGNEPNSN